MKTLTVQWDPDEAFGKHVLPTAKITLKPGAKELWVCDDFDELVEAMSQGKQAFLAHKIEGMQPVDVIVHPSAVAAIERQS